MDFLRTLKKRKPKKYVTARVNAASPVGVGPKRRLVGAKKILKAS
jgi:hypothetical protein